MHADPPSAHLVKDTKGVGRGVIIRPYADADESQVLSLFASQQKEGVPGAPINDALRDHLTWPSALFTYASTTVGIVVLWTRFDGSLRSLVPVLNSAWYQSQGMPSFRDLFAPILAVVVPLASAVRLILFRKALRASFNGYVTMSLGMDLKDIGAYYMGFDRSRGKGLQTLADEEVRGRENLFWVAEDTTNSQIVGIVGLDATLNKDQHAIELRRMAVALDYRRRGIGRELTRTLVNHVKALNARLGKNRDKFTSIKLMTTSFQVNAMRMYARHGWVKTKTTPDTQKLFIFGGLLAPRYTVVVQHMALNLTVPKVMVL